MADARRSAGRASRAVALPLHVQLAGPIMPTARIYQRAKNAMQSGRARAEEWLLEYEPSEPRRADPLTGCAGSGDTRPQTPLSFPSLAAASTYADKKGLNHPVTPAAPRPTKPPATPPVG